MKRALGFASVLLVLLILAPAVASAQAASGQTAKRPVALDDLFKIKGVGDPQRSPDGKWVAYTVGTTDLEKDKRDTDLWMVAWDGGEETPPEPALHTPRWAFEPWISKDISTRDDTYAFVDGFIGHGGFAASAFGAAGVPESSSSSAASASLPATANEGVTEVS